MTEVGLTIMGFGKHKGKPFCEIPESYLEWCLNERAGGYDFAELVGQFLSKPVPKKVISYAGQTIPRDELERLKRKLGFTPINRYCEGIDVMGVCNCEAFFDPNADWPERQEWDHSTAPWLDQQSESDQEFVEMFK